MSCWWPARPSCPCALRCTTCLHPSLLQGPCWIVGVMFKVLSVLGAPGWLSRLSVPLQLRSRCCGLWVRAPRRALCCSSEPEACFGFCVPLSLCSFPTHALSVSLKYKHSKKNLKKNKVLSVQSCHYWSWDAGLWGQAPALVPPSRPATAW